MAVGMREPLQKRSRWVAIFAVVVTIATASASEPTLSAGVCRVISPLEMRLDCQLAAFGRYLSTVSQLDDTPLNTSPTMTHVRVPPEHERLACDPLTTDGDIYYNASVIVDRGGCAFQDKLENVAAAGGAAMILVNSDDSTLMLGALSFKAIDAVAISISRSQGDQLRVLLKENDNGNTAELQVELAARINEIEQATKRIQYFSDVNAPVAAFESFWDAALSLSLPTLEDLVQSIVTNDSIDWRDAFAFFLTSSNLLSRWDFADEASLYASTGVAALISSTLDKRTGLNMAKVLETAAHRLIAAGYYTAGRVLLDRRMKHAIKRKAKTKASEISCQIAVTRFLEAELLGSVEDSTARCTELESKLSTAVPSIEVAEQTLHRLSALDTTDIDRRCLMKAVGEVGEDSDQHCCFHEKSKQRITLNFQTRFVSELYRSLNLMGVFTDELGAFNASLRFFEQANRLCNDGPSLKLRRAGAVPVVFDSEVAMHDFFYEDLPGQLHALEKELDASTVVEQSVSALGDTSVLISSRRPEDAEYLRYTITPSTMLIGYQGYNVLPIQQTIYQLRSKLFPTLTSVYTPTTRADSITARKRIGFISSWFRQHSVGKLLIGVLERLDRQQFEVVIYRCVHFLRDGDEMTEAFKTTADIYVELPIDHESAIARLHNDQLDIAIFPELGMDAWTVLLSHHRVAPVQSVFWGHPITTGNPNIDFSISSQYFMTEDTGDVRDGGVPGADDHQDSEKAVKSEDRHSFRIQQPTGNIATTSERVLLFRGLSTIFTKPSDIDKRRKHAADWNGITRANLHLPENRRLYVCPQTLMKLNPKFDAVIDGILAEDPLALVVLLASDTQKVWTEQLRRRFRRRLDKNAYRVRFLPTLPYDKFMALLSLSDVMLDPFPFGGGVTTLDALSLGIPVVTLPSAQTVVQLAAGFLRYMNATEGIVDNVQEYITIAVDVASNVTKRQRIRETLLTSRDVIYEDQSAVDDWNTFLATAGSL